MKQLLNIHKPQGLTPLEVITLMRQKFPEFKAEKIGFAGRLDPLAHGVLLLMVGEETTKEKDQYLNLSKAYEFEAVFGMATDTYDALGMVTANERQDATDLKKQIEIFIKSKLGKQKQTYPPFSSKTVNGKPLFWYAKNNKLKEIKMPKREIEIFDFHLVKINTIPADKLKKEIFRQIGLVQGDFRQEIIKKHWQKFFEDNKQINFQTARFILSCSSGTYVRSLVSELGEQLGTGAITLEILRTKVGEYTLENAIKLS